MSLKNLLRTEVEKLKLSDDEKESLYSKVLYKLSQNDYFGKAYEPLCLSLYKGMFAVFSPKINNIIGATNSRYDSFILDNKYNYIENEFDDDDISKIYIKDYEINAILKIEKILEKSNTIYNLKKYIEKEDNTIIHVFLRHLSKDNKNLLKIFEKSLDINKKLNKDYKSRIRECLGFNSCSFMLRDVFNVYDLANILREKKKGEYNFIENYLKKEKPSNYKLMSIYKDTSISKVPDDILELFDMEINDEYYQTIHTRFTEKYNSKLINLLNKHTKTNDIFEELLADYFFENKNSILDEYKKSIMKFESINSVVDTKQVNDLEKKVLSKFIEFNASKKDLKLSIERSESKASNSVYDTPYAYEEIKEKNNLQIICPFDIDVIYKGQDFSKRTSFKAGSSKDKLYYSLKTENDLIAVMHIVKESKNTIKVGSVSVSDHFKKMGMAYKLYEKAYLESIKNNCVFVNTYYTTDGNNFIPKIKEKLSLKYPDGLFIDTDVTNSDLNEFNDLFVTFLNKNNDNFSLNTFKTLYSESLKDFMKNIETANTISYDLKYQIFEKFINKYEEKKELSKKNKRHI